MDASENIAMWDEYAPRTGAAIRTTVGLLHSSLNGCYDTNIHMARVEYYESHEEEQYDAHAGLGSLFIKHTKPPDRSRFGSLRHEKELRAVAYRINDGRGVNIPVASNVLINSLVLSPDLPDWAVPIITELITAHGFAGQTERSSAKSSRTAPLDAKCLIAGLRHGQRVSSPWYEGNSSAKGRDAIETAIRKIQESDAIPE